jgi:phosphatidate cytidylyltransferase
MANETLAKFRTRGITGLLFVIAVLALIGYSRYTAAIFIFIVCVTCSFEYTNISRKGVKDPLFNLSFVAGIGPLIFSYIKPEIIEDYEIIILAISFIIMCLFALSSILTRVRTNHNLLGPGIILFYIGLPMMCISRLLVLAPDSYYSYVLIGLMFFLWASDTGSYVVGRLIGRNPLHKRISPNKTIEGWLGGIPFVLLFGYILHLFFDDFSISQWMILGVAVWLLGSIGDLFESTIKRQFQIKDSGNGLPGHGGFLDRFDSLLFAGPLFTLIIYLIYNF